MARKVMKAKKETWTEQAIRTKLRKTFPKFEPYVLDFKKTEAFKAMKKTRAMYDKGVFEGKYTINEIGQLFGPATVSSISHAAQEAGMLPGKVTVLVDLGAWGLTFTLMEAQRRRRVIPLQRRETEKHVKVVRVGPYNPYKALSVAHMRVKGAPTWAEMPMLQMWKPKTIEGHKYKQTANTVGNMLADYTNQGSTLLFKEIKKKGHKIITPAAKKDPKFALKKLFETHEEHAHSTVNLANFISAKYKHLLTSEKASPGLKKIVQIAAEIVEDANELQRRPKKIERPPPNFTLMMFSKKMQEIVQKEKKPQLKMLGVLDFFAGAVQKKKVK